MGVKDYNIRDFLEGKLTLSQIWEDSYSEPSDESREDFISLGDKILNAERRRRGRRRILLSVLGAVAVLAVAVLFSITVNHYKNIDYKQITALNGQNLQLTLPDGSDVFLQAGSTIVYPLRFASGTRSVFLTGCANFSVHPDKRKPFIVKTQHLDVEALGTRFCVMAYPNAHSVSATLMEGIVRVDVKQDTVKSFFLQCDSQLRYIPSTKDISLFNVNAERVAAWEKGYLIFEDASFQEIIEALERRFEVDVNYDSGLLVHDTFHVRIHPDDSLEDALKMISGLMPGSRYVIDGEEVYVFSR